MLLPVVTMLITCIASKVFVTSMEFFSVT